ncbi:hypothetical protein A0H76_65 [Hepatospora eriocheir]|uniref:Uncharacterized protein n=1 Tax=Hepatospora eriocheir TaxID=1081669 RepID=A0A1X0QJA1_9MICR|nr:hypothetical protein A0H76_65 [Hepatospora eriocheir]
MKPKLIKVDKFDYKIVNNEKIILKSINCLPLKYSTNNSCEHFNVIDEHNKIKDMYSKSKRNIIHINDSLLIIGNILNNEFTVLFNYNRYKQTISFEIPVTKILSENDLIIFISKNYLHVYQLNFKSLEVNLINIYEFESKIIDGYFKNELNILFDGFILNLEKDVLKSKSENINFKSIELINITSYNRILIKNNLLFLQCKCKLFLIHNYNVINSITLDTYRVIDIIIYESHIYVLTAISILSYNLTNSEVLSYFRPRSELAFKSKLGKLYASGDYICFFDDFSGYLLLDRYNLECLYGGFVDSYLCNISISKNDLLIIDFSKVKVYKNFIRKQYVNQNLKTDIKIKEGELIFETFDWNFIKDIFEEKKTEYIFHNKHELMIINYVNKPKVVLEDNIPFFYPNFYSWFKENYEFNKNRKKRSKEEIEKEEEFVLFNFLIKKKK